MKTYADYEAFQAEDFLNDLPFQTWVRQPTPEMDAYWQGLLGLHPHLRSAFDHARLLALGLEASWINFSDAYVDAAYQRLELCLPDSELLPAEWPAEEIKYDGKRGVGIIWKQPAWISTVAAAVVLLIASLFTYSYFFRSQVFQTQYGEVKTVTLYDGSTVTLNANSRLVQPSRYRWRTERSVQLNGEAYFAVHKQPLRRGYRKFTVRTAQINVEVYGTQFDVYARFPKTRVQLDEGQIQLTGPVTHQRLTMRPGQIAQLTLQKPVIRLSEIVPHQRHQATSWQRNKLLFTNADMDELAERFAEIYGLELVLTGEIFDGQQFQGELPVNDVEQAISIITQTFGVRAIREERRIHFVYAPTSDQ